MTPVNWGVATDVGSFRETNEDSVLARPPVFVVADGMGGHAGGEVASALAVSELDGLQGRESIDKNDVEAAILRANERILDTARTDAGAEGMGTTITGIAIVTPGGVEHWLVFNVGDSRVYRFADDRLTQITVDHSETQELIDLGRITTVEAESHHLRNVVTRALGVDPAPEIDWWLLPVVAGERFVICSDGLSRELSDDEIADVLRSSKTAATAGELVDRAVAAGGRDNVTVIAVDVEPGEDSEAELDEDTLPRIDVRSLITKVPRADA